MPNLTWEISFALKEALDKQSTSGGESVDHQVSTALSRFFDVPLHTLFQVSATRIAPGRIEFWSYLASRDKKAGTIH